MVGTSLPTIQSYLNIDIKMAGFMMAILQIGFTLFTLISGILSDLYSRERILAFGCFLLSIGSLFLGFTTSLVFNMCLVSEVGADAYCEDAGEGVAGLGCILSGTNALLAGLYPDNKRKILNIHHVFFSLGSFVGPLLIGYLITQTNNWRWGYVGEGFLLLILCFVFLFVNASDKTVKKRSKFVSQVKLVVRDRGFLLILIVNSLAVGTQLSVILLGVTYLQQAKHCSLSEAGIALSVFAITMMVGRIICSRFSAAIQNSTIILILLGLQLAAMLFTWLGNGSLALIALALSGFGFSGIYPTSLALTGILFPHVEGSSLGIISTTAGVGSILLCGAIGYVAGISDMQTGFSLIVIACLLGFLLFLFFYTRMSRRESSLGVVYSSD